MQPVRAPNARLAGGRLPGDSGIPRSFADLISKIHHSLYSRQPESIPAGVREEAMLMNRNRKAIVCNFLRKR
jgi:hypothetical protein